jgi:hypothetical protein
LDTKIQELSPFGMKEVGLGLLDGGSIFILSPGGAKNIF